MASLDWSRCLAVESSPGKVSGAWVFEGTRTPAAVVFENLEDGMTYPSLDLMRVLFDNGTPRGVASALTNHTVEETRAHGWDTLRNGESSALVLHPGSLDQRARKPCDVPALRSFLHGDDTQSPRSSGPDDVSESLSSRGP